MPVFMADLPQELLDHVASFLDHDEEENPPSPSCSQIPGPTRNITTYATISKPWQYAIERRTFRDLKFYSSDLQRFFDIVVGHRRRYPDTLHCFIDIPIPSGDENSKLDSYGDRIFSDLIHGLLHRLASWERDTASKGENGSRLGTMALSLSTMWAYPSGSGVSGALSSKWFNPFAHKPLRLLRPQHLPSVHLIDCFRTFLSDDQDDVPIEPGSIATIAAKLRNVWNIDWELSDNEKQYPKLRRDLRYNFAKALLTIHQAPLIVFNLSYEQKIFLRHEFTPRNALYQFTPTVDDISLALHKISQSPKLMWFCINGPILISPDLYWPQKPTTSADPFWPTLQHHIVRFSNVSPHGDWYFIQDPKSDVRRKVLGPDTDEPIDENGYTAREEAFFEDQSILFPSHKFRNWPDSDKINPLLVAMARAAARMPQLEMMQLQCDCGGRDAPFQVLYLAPNAESAYVEKHPEDKGKFRLYWIVGKWRPDEDVLTLWNKVKSSDKEEEFVIRFFDEDPLATDSDSVESEASEADSDDDDEMGDDPEFDWYDWDGDELRHAVGDESNSYDDEEAELEAESEAFVIGEEQNNESLESLNPGEATITRLET